MARDARGFDLLFAVAGRQLDAPEPRRRLCPGSERRTENDDTQEPVLYAA